MNQKVPPTKTTVEPKVVFHFDIDNLIIHGSDKPFTKRSAKVTSKYLKNASKMDMGNNEPRLQNKKDDMDINFREILSQFAR